jgi:hypothetical protein
LAAAAAVLLALGTVALVLGRSSGAGSNATASTPANALPATFVADLVATHDECCRLADHHFLKGVPPNDFAAISDKLRGQLGHPVMTGPVGGADWSFRGAAVCVVGSTPSAHLVFAHDAPREFISVFSLPASVVARQSAGGPCYESLTTGHAITGFAEGGGFYCLVGSSSERALTVDELRSIRNRLRREMRDVGVTTVAAKPTPTGEGAIISVAQVRDEH